MKGQRTMAVMVMVLVVLGMMMGQVRAEPEACMQQLEHMKATNQTKVLAVMIDSTGKAWNDLGKWDECKDLGAHISHYCTVSYKIPGNTADGQTGFCLPSDCTVSDIVNLTGAAVIDLDDYVNWRLHNYSIVPVVAKVLSDIDEVLGKVVNFTEHLKFDSVCSPPTPSIWSRPGAVVMIVLSLVIGIIVIMGTLLDGYDANWWPEPDTTVSSPQLGGIQDTAEVQPLLAANKGGHQRRSKLFDFFVAFSVARNFKSLVGPSPPGLAFLNGMRAISISWVILGHSLDYMNYAGVLNFAHVIVKDSKHGSAQAFPGAEFSVDSFFWLSGFLVTYLTVKELKTKKRVNWFLYYFHRVWRLSPAYFYALFFYMFVSVGISDGPMWPEYMEKVDQTCGKYWWTNLVYVNNFIPANNWQGQCFLWGWYLAVDMQLYIIAPIIFLLYHKNKIIGWALVIILTVGSVVANGVIAHKEHLQWNALDPHVYMSMVYGKPYTRAAPWLLGIACAFLYLEKKQLQRIVVYVGWAVSGVVMALCIYGPTHQYIGGGSILEMGTFKNTWGDGSKAWTYFTFSKLGWSLAVSFLMYSMAMGWGGFFRRFLGAQMWSPLARLTYSAYLFHPIIMFVVYYSHLQYFSYDHFYMGVIYVGMLVLSFSTAVVMFLAIERPMTNMEKLFLPHKK